MLCEPHIRQVVRDARVVGYLLVVLLDGVLLEAGDEDPYEVEEGDGVTDNGRGTLQLWDLASGGKLCFSSPFEGMEVHSFSVSGEEVLDCGLRLWIAAGGHDRHLLGWCCDTWRYDGAADDAWVYNETCWDFQLSELADEKANVIGVHLDAHKLLAAMGCILTCKVIRRGELVNMWTCCLSGSVNSMEVSPRYAVLHTSDRAGQSNDQLLVLDVGEVPALQGGHGVVGRGFDGAAYQSDASSSDAELDDNDDELIAELDDDDDELFAELDVDDGEDFNEEEDGEGGQGPEDLDSGDEPAVDEAE